MKKLLTILMFLISIRALAPEAQQFFFICVTKPISIYEPLIRALVYVEVKNGEDLYNEIENAVGYFQVRPIRVEDYNKKLGTNYVLEDFYDYELSRQMFLYYARGKSFEQAARSWNGSGPKTIEYWNKVKSYI